MTDWLMRVARRAMATEFEVLLPHRTPESEIDVAMKSLDEVERLEQILSVYRPLSAISRLNAQAGSDVATYVGEEIIEIFEMAARVSELTQGAFDITAGPLVAAWGFLQRSGRKPTTEEIAQARSLVNWQEVEFTKSTRKARLPRVGMQVNLGGIGKGYAIDRAARELFLGSVSNYLAHGGQSSAIAKGNQSPDQEGWKVALHHPTRSGVRLGSIQLMNAALATSGSGKQFFHHQGKRMGHVIDPRTGWPAGDMLSLTVIAPTAMEADALATGLFVLGREAAWEFVKNRNEIGLIAVSAGQREAEVVIDKVNVEAIWQDNLDGVGLQ